MFVLNVRVVGVEVDEGFPLQDLVTEDIEPADQGAEGALGSQRFHLRHLRGEAERTLLANDEMECGLTAAICFGSQKVALVKGEFGDHAQATVSHDGGSVAGEGGVLEV